LIQDNAAGECDRISLHLRCESCGDVESFVLPARSYTDAAEEFHVGRFQCDVVALRDDVPRLAIEIMHTHAMTSAKVAELSCRWIELVAADVLDSPAEWRPKRSHWQRRQPHQCADCLSGRKRPLVKVERLPNEPHAAIRHLWSNAASLRPFRRELEQHLQNADRKNKSTR
jgi:hypothetical protein